MKTAFFCLLAIGICSSAMADVQLQFANAVGEVNSMQSNGSKVRIDGGPTPGYLIVDSATGEFFVVDVERSEIIKVAPDEVGRVADTGQLNVSLKTRGGREKVAGYTTGRYDLLANGEFCGSVYGSSELIKNPQLNEMFKAMQGMHRVSRSMVAGFGDLLTECQRAEARLADLVDISGLVLRFIDHQGIIRYDAVSVDLEAQVDPARYELPADMPVIDLNDRIREANEQGAQMQQQMPSMQEMQQMMQQMEQMQQAQ